MPKIPTYQARGRPTAEVGAVKTNIKLSPFATPAAALMPVAEKVSEYYLKQKELANKTEANKKFFEIQNDVDIIQERLKNNIQEDESVNLFNQGYKIATEEKINQIKNNRVKELLQTKLNIEYPEYLLKVKKNSRNALEQESVASHNSSQNIYMSQYYFANEEEQKIIKDKLIQNEIDFNTSWMTGKPSLDKAVKKIESDLYIGKIKKNITDKNYGQALSLLKDVDSSKFLDYEERIKLVGEVKEGFKITLNENNVDNILKNSVGFYAKSGQLKDTDGKNITNKQLQQGMVRMSQEVDVNGQLVYTQPQLAQIAIANNTVNPIHKEGINAGYNNLSATGNQEYVKQGYKLYKIYSTQRGRNFMRGTMKIDRSAIEMYDRMDFALNAMKMTEGQAIQATIKIQQDINLPETQRKRVNEKDVQAATGNIVDQNWSWKEAENSAFISDTIRRVANTVFKIGGTKEDAIEYAESFIDQNYYLDIFGNLVPAKTNRPGYHDTTLKIYIKQLWDQGKINKEQNELDDIIAVDISPNQFSDVEGVEIINKKTRQVITMFENAQGDFDEDVYDQAVFTQKQLHEKVYPLAQDERYKDYIQKYIDRRDQMLLFNEQSNIAP
tara:strand:- start:3663 stop:5498 length:1836 start_codon:yes stop_codon:yes gene_type:complete